MKHFKMMGLGERIFKVDAERYFEAVKYLDSLSGIKKEIEGDFIVYSPAELNPELKVRAMTGGWIKVNNSQRSIILPVGLQLVNGLEKELRKKILDKN